MQFFVSPDRRSVMHLEVWDLPVACKGLRSTDLPSYLVVDSARIQRDGTFRTNFGIPGRITLTGRFLGHGRASGTVRYRVRGPDKGCTADGIWTAHVSPPRPPVQHFAGTTSEGTRVTFERTIERHPRVTRFDFGLLRVKFPDGDSCGSRGAATGQVPVRPRLRTRVRAARPPSRTFLRQLRKHGRLRRHPRTLWCQRSSEWHRQLRRPCRLHDGQRALDRAPGRLEGAVKPSGENRPRYQRKGSITDLRAASPSATAVRPGVDLFRGARPEVAALFTVGSATEQHQAATGSLPG